MEPDRRQECKRRFIGKRSEDLIVIGGGMKGLHVPTVLVGVIISAVFGAGVYFSVSNATAKTVEKHGEKIEKNEGDIGVIKIDVAGIKKDVSYMRETQDRMDVSQTSLHSKLDQLLQRGTP